MDNSFSRGALYQMLQNRVYRGEIVHKGAAYPGGHPPIVDEDLWASVQRKLEANDVERSTRREASQRQLLAGVLFDADGEPITPTHAVKKGVRYRYYVSRRLITGKRGDGEIGRDSGQRLPASLSNVWSFSACGRSSPIPTLSAARPARYAEPEARALRSTRNHPGDRRGHGGE